MFNLSDFNTCILAQEIKPNGFETVRYHSDETLRNCMNGIATFSNTQLLLVHEIS